MENTEKYAYYEHFSRQELLEHVVAYSDQIHALINIIQRMKLEQQVPGEWLQPRT